METLNALFEETLKDIYFAEKHILKALPKMARKTKSPVLKKAFEAHADETKGQIERLEQVFQLLGKKPTAKECPALLGLVEEAEEVMTEAKDPDVLNAGLIACAQAVEHYEMARYGTLRAWAGQLGMPEAVKLLETTLEEEKSTDEKLTGLAMGGMNAAADNDEDGGEGEEKSPAKRAPARAASAKPAAPRGGAKPKASAGRGTNGRTALGGRGKSVAMAAK